MAMKYRAEVGCRTPLCGYRRQYIDIGRREAERIAKEGEHERSCPGCHKPLWATVEIYDGGGSRRL